MSKEVEKLKRDLAGLQESIRFGWQELFHRSLTLAERTDIRQQINASVDDLRGILHHLGELDEMAQPDA